MVVCGVVCTKICQLVHKNFLSEHSKYLTSFFLSRMMSPFIYTFGVRYDMLLHDSWLIFYKNNPKYCAMNRLPSVTPPPHICQMWNVNSRFSLLINHDQWSTGWNYQVGNITFTIISKNCSIDFCWFIGQYNRAPEHNHS